MYIQLLASCNSRIYHRESASCMKLYRNINLFCNYSTYIYIHASQFSTGKLHRDSIVTRTQITEENGTNSHDILVSFYSQCRISDCLRTTCELHKKEQIHITNSVLLTFQSRRWLLYVSFCPCRMQTDTPPAGKVVHMHYIIGSVGHGLTSN